MDKVFTDEWLSGYQAQLASDHPYAVEFREAARWFDGCFLLRCGKESAWFMVARGEVSVGLGEHDATVVVTGEEEAWRELFDPDTVNGVLNRLWRQGKVTLTGDLVTTMKFWKSLFWLTEVGDLVPFSTAAPTDA